MSPDEADLVATTEPTNLEVRRHGPAANSGPTPSALCGSVKQVNG
jgi:hypothetical protein